MSGVELLLRTTVIKVEGSELDELRNLLLKVPSTAEKRTTSKYESFRIRYSGGSIIGYTSGKVVITSEPAVQLVREVLQKMGLKDANYDLVIGSDEAGKGEWLGPMVVAAVALTPTQASDLRAEGVMDSKDLSLDRISELANVIAKLSTALKTVTLPPDAFNALLKEFHDEGKNLNDLLACRVIDLDSVDLIQRPHAEDEIAVAASSIVARNAREDWIDETSARLEMNLRTLSMKEAANRDDTNLYAKTSYLRRD
jgi:ribonuclease HIII